MTVTEALAQLSRYKKATLVFDKTTGEIVEVVDLKPYDSKTNCAEWNALHQQLSFAGKTGKDFSAQGTTEQDVAAFVERCHILNAKHELNKSILHYEFRSFGYTFVRFPTKYILHDNRTLPSDQGALPGALKHTLLSVKGLPAENLSPLALAEIGAQSETAKLIFNKESQLAHHVIKRVFPNILGELQSNGKPGCSEDIPRWRDGPFPIVLF